MLCSPLTKNVTRHSVRNRIKRIHLWLSVGVVALVVACWVETQHPEVKRIELQRHDIGIPGREAVQVRFDFGAEAVFGEHACPGEKVIYVLEGLLEYQIEGRSPVVLSAGEVLFIPAGTVHSAKNVGSNNASELATYIVEKEKPLLMTEQ